MAVLYRPPLPNLRKTFDYLPSRDGLALQIGGAGRVDSRAGYIADVAANPLHIWQPRQDQNAYSGFLSTTKGQNNQDLGHYHWQADPEFSWSNGFSPFAIDGDGYLRIRAQPTASVTPAFAGGEIPNDPNTGASFPWVSGMLTTKDAFSQRGGYWEIDAKCPTGKAAWPAIWLYPQGEPLGYHIPEIDIMESFGGEPGFSASVYHVNRIGTGYVASSSSYDTGVDIGAGFHKYGFSHTENTLRYYFDGALIATKDVTSAPEFWTGMYLLLSMTIGSRISNFVPAPDGTTPNPADMLIRSVRCWQFTT